MSKGVTFNDNKGPVTIIEEGGSARPSILGKLIEIIATYVMKIIECINFV